MARHQIPFDTGEEERLIGPLSTSETLWLAGGIFVSYQLIKIFPPLPLPNVLAYLHYLIPLGISVLMAFVKYKDMTFMQLFQTWIRFKRRKKSLRYEYRNIFQGKEGKRL